MLVATAAPASASTTFDDQFDGSSVNATVWNTDVATSGERFCNDSPDSDTGTWVDISADPSCHGVLVSPPYASITEGDGVASFAAPAGHTFGYLVAGPPSRHPFPSAGDFVLELRMRYDVGRQNGDGAMVLASDNADPVGTSSPLSKRILQVWGDQRGVYVAVLGNGGPLANPTGFHDYRLEYTGGAYSLFIDGTLAHGPIASAVRPTSVWLGHPDAVWWGSSEWTSFSVDSIRVTSPDTVAPVSAVAYAPPSPSGSNGWYVGPVVVTVSATDDQSGVAETRCVVDPFIKPASFDDLAPACDSGATVTANGHHLVYAASRDEAGNQEVPAVGGFYIDANPPVTRGVLTPDAPQGSNWYTAPVKVRVTANDGGTGGGSHVAETRCALDPATAPTRFGDLPTNCRYLTQTTVGAEGRHALYFASRDVAGNKERPHRLSWKLDRTPPTLRCTVTPAELAPSDHRLVGITTGVQVGDAMSGAAGFTLTSVTSNQPDGGLAPGDQPDDIQGWTTGTNDRAGKLRAEAYVSTRTYTIAYQARDAAGNTHTCALPVRAMP